MDSFEKEDRRQNRFDFRDDLRDRGERLSRSGTNATAQEFGRISNALHVAADKLHEHNDYFAGLVDNLAERSESASKFLTDRQPQEIFDAVQDFSRRNPYLTVGGMFAAGLALSRFLKAGRNNEPQSQEDRYEPGA
jgi:hypothetical protein